MASIEGEKCRPSGTSKARPQSAQPKAVVAISRARTSFVACGRESESEIVEFRGVARVKVSGAFLQKVLVLTPYCSIAGWHQFTSCAFVLSSSLRSLQSGRARERRVVAPWQAAACLGAVQAGPASGGHQVNWKQDGGGSGRAHCSQRPSPVSAFAAVLTGPVAAGPVSPAGWRCGSTGPR